MPLRYSNSSKRISPDQERNALRKALLLITFLPGWILYMISGLFPRDTSLLIFGTHTNAFAGNIKALLLQYGPPIYKKIFIGKTKKIVQTARKLGIESYWKYSPKGIWYSLRAGLYVYSSYPSDINYWLSRGAKYIDVWHGTPLKKIERDVETGHYALRNRYKKLFAVIMPYLFTKPDVLLVASEFEKECFRTAFGVEEEAFMEAFPPRLASLESEEPLSVKKSKKILYAPTWRDDHSFVLYHHLDLKQFNAFLESSNTVMYIKPHPSDLAKHLDYEYSQISLVPKEKDIYKLLVECDTLLTDYSSMLFEALYLNKNVALFCPDYDRYQKSSREFYLDPCHDLKLPTSYDTASLIQTISTAIKQRNDSYQLSDRLKSYTIIPNLLEKIIMRFL